MKKLKFVLGLAGIFTLMMLSSCSNLDPFGKDTQNSNEKNYVSFTINTSPSGRFIAADSSYDITAVTTWKLSYTEESTDDAATKTITYTKDSTTTDSTTTDSSTTYLTEEEGSLKVCNFPVGTYTFELTGTYTDEQTESQSHTVYGKTTNVEIVSGKTNSVSIIVGSKRTETGTGSLNLTFNGLSSDNNNYKGLSISLVNLTEDKTIILDYSITGNLELNINKDSIPSGLYKIEITYTGYKISIDNGDCFVEIADDVTTTKSDITLSCETKKIFYATNEDSSYNGLALVSPKNLTRLLLNNIEYIEEQNISIYMGDESPEIDIAAVNSIKEKQLGKTIDIYKGTPTSGKKCLSISDSGIDFSGELTLIPNVDNKLEVNLITVNQGDAYTITLKDGTSLSIETDNLLGNLTIKATAVDSTTNKEKDNFLAYMETPFITAKTDITTNLQLYYVEENATEYTIVSQVSEDQKTYSYYLKPSSTSGLNVQSYTDAKITAQYEDDDPVYTTGEDVEIPYTNATLTLSLTGIENSTVNVIDWYLNDESLSAGSFNPYINKVNIDNSNTVTCLFSVDGTYYISKFEFKLVQIKTTAVYSYSQPNYKYAQIAYVEDYTSLTGDSIYVKDKNSADTTSEDETYGAYEDFYWCLDNASNLWVLWNMILYKYSYDSNSYNTTGEKIIDLTGPIPDPYTVKDIYYNNGYIYLLEKNSSDINVYQVAESTGAYSTAKISNGNNLSFNQIAVYGNDIYVSDNTSIYKMGFEQNGETITLENPEEFYTSLSTDFPDSSTEIKITDLQIGDGCGNNTDTLFALVRDIDTDTVIDSDSSKTSYKYYSRGGLLSISTDNKNSKVQGYNNTNSSTSTYTVSNNSTEVVLYSPEQSSKTEFFGPTHFCAVVPKKLVILDDGFVFVGNNEKGEVLVSKKDGFMEFDIANESLNKYSENINAFEYLDSYKSLFGTGFDTTDYYGKQ